MPEPEEFRGGYVIGRDPNLLAEPFQIFPFTTDDMVGSFAPGMVVFVYGYVASFGPSHSKWNILKTE